VRALSEAARGDRLEALYFLAVTARLRRGELQGLTWEEVDLDAGTLQVRRTPSEPRGGYIFKAPESGLTLNVYSHVLPDMGDIAAGAMDAALG
jgi:integrase